MSKKISKLLVNQVVKKIENLDSDIEIRDFLRKNGFDDSDERNEITDIAEKIINDKLISGDLRDQNYLYLIKDLKKKNSSDEELLDIVHGLEKKPKTTEIVRKISPLTQLLSDSFYSFFTNIHKYFLLFSLYFLVPGILYGINSKTGVVGISYYGSASFIFFSIIFFLSLSRYIGENNDGIFFSIKFSLVNFIPALFTLLLIFIPISSLLFCSYLVYDYFFVISPNKIYLFIAYLFIAISILMMTYYSLVFFVIANEEEFYINAITRSRIYLKNHLISYLSRVLVFLVIYAMVVALIILASSSILSMLGVFDFVSFALDPDFNFLFSKITDFRFIIVTVPLGFFLYVWPIIFGQVLYQDLGLHSNLELKLSIKHQNLFFIILVLNPFIIMFVSYLACQNTLWSN